VNIFFQEYLKSENKDKLALFLLCGISSVITGGNVDLREEDIYQLCYMCCEALEVENLAVNKYKFLCSLYHIIKYHVNQVMTGLCYCLHSCPEWSVLLGQFLPFFYILEIIYFKILLVNFYNMVTSYI
jgi:hypothetical protein